MEEVFQVIVIGAGISGVGASIELTKANIDHIILESRDRIGGRIASTFLDGLQIQLGATYVHCPQSNNKIADFIKTKGIQTKVADLHSFTNSQFIFQGEEQVSEDTKSRSFALFEDLCKEIQGTKEALQDLSIGQMSQYFFKQIENEPQKVRSIVKCLLYIMVSYEGANISDHSAKQFDNVLSECDLLPHIGYSAVLKEIAKETKAEIKLNQVVTRIDYEGQLIKVETKNRSYFAKKVISSLPLGVLQSNAVEFHPKIPEDHRANLSKIGVSKVIKLFVSFEEPFWDTSKENIFLVSKQIKYPVAASFVKEGKYILCFVPSITQNAEVNSFSDEELLEDFLAFLKKFKLSKQIKVRSLLATKWDVDPFALGAYSFPKVGQIADLDAIRKPINNKIWFVGEYCHPFMNGCAHGALETGEWAAKEIVSQIKKE